MRDRYALIADLNDIGWSDQRIAEHTSGTLSSITAARERLGLPPAEDRARRGHSMRVILDQDTVRLIPECHEPDGAICRVVYGAGCKTYSYPEHEHEFKLLPYGNAVEFLSNSDVECCCDWSGDVLLCDGMSIEVTWDGDQYEWFPVHVAADTGEPS